MLCQHWLLLRNYTWDKSQDSYSPSKECFSSFHQMYFGGDGLDNEYSLEEAVVRNMFGSDILGCYFYVELLFPGAYNQNFIMSIFSFPRIRPGQCPLLNPTPACAEEITGCGSDNECSSGQRCCLQKDCTKKCVVTEPLPPPRKWLNILSTKETFS